MHGSILRCALAIAPLCACAAASALEAPAYPARPVRMIVPFSPGGGADQLARTLQPGLSAAFGQSLVIDNRGGASGIIGTELAARAAPDGYTVLLVTTTHTVIPSMVAKLPYDPIKDFAAVSLVVTQPNILVVHPSVAAKSVKELVALGKTGKLTYASGGNGSQPHLGAELLKIVAGIDITHVPFKGSGPGVAAVLGGQVSMMLVGPLAIEGHVRAGKLRALAVADNKRSAILPDVPTAAEAGFAGIESGTWYGILAPARTPQAVVAALHGALARTTAHVEVKSRLLAQGAEIVGSSPAAFDKKLAAELAKWSQIVKRAGIEMQ
ncbi:MAG: tripartite tricarboxylate transporter substrate binding protein [Burkholderiales bacterium]|nr:tripartite tricarboxylate transporter substrate binding protein [Burkholderiales bacterium]